MTATGICCPVASLGVPDIGRRGMRSLQGYSACSLYRTLQNPRSEDQCASHERRSLHKATGFLMRRMLMTLVCDASDRGKAAILWHRGSMTENRDDRVYSHGAGHMYHVLHSAHIDAIDGCPLAWIEKVGNGSTQCSSAWRSAVWLVVPRF